MMHIYILSGSIQWCNDINMSLWLLAMTRLFNLKLWISLGSQSRNIMLMVIGSDGVNPKTVTKLFLDSNQSVFKLLGIDTDHAHHERPTDHIYNIMAIMGYHPYFANVAINRRSSPFAKPSSSQALPIFSDKTFMLARLRAPSSPNAFSRMSCASSRTASIVPMGALPNLWMGFRPYSPVRTSNSSYATSRTHRRAALVDWSAPNGQQILRAFD